MRSSAKLRNPPAGTLLWPGALLLIVVGGLYLLFPARLYFGEGFKWALSTPADSGGLFRFFHPHHLLYNPLGHLVHRLLTLPFPQLPEMISFRLMDTLFGLGGVLVFYNLARRILDRPLPALLASLGLAFSWGYWSHAINVEVYAPSLFFLALGLALAVRLITDPNPAGVWRWGFLGISTAMAVLCHQSNLLFLLVPVGAIFLTPVNRRVAFTRFCGVFLPIFILVTGLPYIIVLAIHVCPRSPGDALHWLLLYGHQLDTYLGTDMGVLRLALRSLVSVLALPGSYTALSADPLLPPPLLGAMRLLCLLLILILLPRLILRSGRQALGRRKPVLFLLALFALPYLLFFTFWDPGGYFFWIPMLLPVWLLLGLAAESGTGSKVRLPYPLLLLILLVILLTTVNFIGGILPESRPDRVDDERLLSFVSQHVGDDDLLLLNTHRMEVISNFGGPMFYAYARAFAPFEVAFLLPPILVPDQAEQLARRLIITGHGERHVYYLDEILHVRRTDGGQGTTLERFFHTAGLGKRLVAVHAQPDAYSGSLLYRLDEERGADVDGLPAGRGAGEDLEPPLDHE